MRWTWNRARRDWLTALGTGGVVAVGWGLAHRLLMGEQRLTDPLAYDGDAMLALGAVAAARRGDYLPFLSKELPSLGAPFVASWNDWPISEDVLLWLVGLVARGVGTIAAVNLGYLVACVTAAISFFLVARRFAVRREAAALGAVLFGLSNYIAVRGVHHFSLTFVWVIPWNVLVGSWLASRRGLPFGSRRFALAAVTTVGTAWGFAYYSFFASQLYVLGTVAGAVRHGWSRQRLRPAMALAGLFCAALVAVHLDSVVWLVKHGRNAAAMARGPSGAEMFALKPIELFVPGEGHRLALGRLVGRREVQQAVVTGEFPSQYLGLLGALALVALCVSAARLVMRGRYGPAVAWAGLAGWLMAAHSVGGLNSLLYLLDSRVFRSTNRASVVLLAVVLLFAGQWLGRFWARRPARVRWAVAAGLAAGGTWEQLPSDGNSMASLQQVAAADRELVSRLEQALAPSSMVFQLPAMAFPEVPPTLGVETYEQFRPTIYATSLRFSHGDVKGRRNAEWKFRLAALPPEQLVAELKTASFSAIYLNRKGYADGGAELERALSSLGCRLIAVSALEDTVAYAL